MKYIYWNNNSVKKKHCPLLLIQQIHTNLHLVYALNVSMIHTTQ